MNINIYVKWDEFGWIATPPDSTSKTGHCSGPRIAAVGLCSKHFGTGNYKILPGAVRLHYTGIDKRTVIPAGVL